MKVFIAWSGDRSLRVAQTLREWLPTVVQRVEPFMSERDIRTGARWRAEVANQLQDCQFGILCLTSDNLQSEWLHFEAGALSKIQEKGGVTSLLLGVTAAETLLNLWHSFRTRDPPKQTSSSCWNQLTACWRFRLTRSIWTQRQLA
jgi:hypothetical protein